MVQRSVLLAVAVVVASAFGVILFDGHRDATAERHLESARRKLAASLVDAPELHLLSASSALSDLDRAVDAGADPSRLRVLRDYAGAIVKLQSRDLLAASRALESARRELGRGHGDPGGPSAADLHVLAGTISRAALDTGEARLQADAALRMEPDHPRALLLTADLALDRGDAAVARASLERLVARAPRASAVHNRLGLALELDGELVRAEEAFRESIRLHRRNADALVNLGRLLAARGELGPAASTYTSAITLAPGGSDGHLGRGLVHLVAGRLDDARRDLERAHELDAEDDAVLVALGDLARSSGDVEGAVGRYREAVRIDGGDAGAWIKLGNALFVLGDVEPALAAYEIAIGLAPELAAAHNGRGAALMRLGRTDPAIGALERAAALDADDPNPLLNLGLLHESAGQRAAARLAFERALERDPGSTAARQLLSAL